MIRLNCMFQPYAWGKPGTTSAVAQLFSAGDPQFSPDANAPYAELWMGTHPKGQSTVWGQDTTLGSWLKSNLDKVGSKLVNLLEKEAGDDSQLSLPFLFKVLSVQKALSIQVHPNKTEAIDLHAKDPANYPDPNHKPEMCIALTPFEVLCSFRPAEQIFNNIKETPELFELIGSEAYQSLEAAIKSKAGDDSETTKQALKECFSSLMLQPEPLVQRNIASVADRVAVTVNTRQKEDVVDNLSRFELLLRLHYHYPGDIGFFMPFFLNHFVLQPGEACFLGPNEPHAYLFGDCIECMACSDNTIRAGLTPKFKDTITLVNCLTYRMTNTKNLKMVPTKHLTDPCTTIYNPPVPEFVVHKIHVEKAGGYIMPPLSSCSIFIVIDGSCDVTKDVNVPNLHKGVIVLIPANHKPQVTVVKAPFTGYRAFCEADNINQIL